MDAFVTSVTTGIDDIVTTALTAMGGVMPKALLVFGATLIVGIVLKVIRRVTGK